MTALLESIDLSYAQYAGIIILSIYKNYMVEKLGGPLPTLPPL